MGCEAVHQDGGESVDQLIPQLVNTLRITFGDPNECSQVRGEQQQALQRCPHQGGAEFHVQRRVELIPHHGDRAHELLVHPIPPFDVRRIVFGNQVGLEHDCEVAGMMQHDPDVGPTAGGQSFRCIIDAFRPCRQTIGEEAETLDRNRGQQPSGVAEMVGRGRVGNSGSSGHFSEAEA